MITRRFSRSRGGFTLLEILLATAIFMTMMVAAIGIFISTTASSSTANQLRINVQTSRFIFETLAREVRLSRGLVLTRAGEDPVFVVPPFRVVARASDGKRGIAIFNVTRTDQTDANDNPKYNVSCKAYGPELDGSGFMVWEYQSELAKTAREIKDMGMGILAQCHLGDLASSSYWSGSVRGNDLLPEGTALKQFALVRWRDYSVPSDPNVLDSPDNITVQPFMQVQLSVENMAYLATGQTGKKARTTLRSMIVPRDFSSKHEVAQEGINQPGS